MSENPYPSPSPVMLAQMLRIQAWKDDIDDDSRKFHEWSADTIEALTARVVRLAKQLEQTETLL